MYDIIISAMTTSRWITQPLYKATLKDLENWNKTHKVSEKVHFINVLMC